MRRECLAGPNFSGRSEALLASLRNAGAPAFFVGPYAEAALSGLSSTVADELAIYREQRARPRPPFEALPIGGMLERKPQSLSGGEQVLLALHCFAQSAFDVLAVDTALEQLDGTNRAGALVYLGCDAFNVALIDNRVVPSGWDIRTYTPVGRAFAIDWPALTRAIAPQHAQPLSIDNLDFTYPKGRQIFRGASMALTPGTAHRLAGANGAGKTTLLKILVGALVPTAGGITLAGANYRPWREGNRALALATQNPDQQWCGATLREDMGRRRAALRTTNNTAAMDDVRLARLAGALGIASLDQHLYELPLAARKRVSWLCLIAGARPWVMLDEPTIGQDDDTRTNLAKLLQEMCAHGYGVIFVTHDDAFAAMLPHRRLQIEDGRISSP
jgi:ATPase subunit of ABC transporter with duplicated ATPase domains